MSKTSFFIRHNRWTETKPTTNHVPSLHNKPLVDGSWRLFDWRPNSFRLEKTLFEIQARPSNQGDKRRRQWKSKQRNTKEQTLGESRPIVEATQTTCMGALE